jgi:hypothetical protein
MRLCYEIYVDRYTVVSELLILVPSLIAFEVCSTRRCDLVEHSRKVPCHLAYRGTLQNSLARLPSVSLAACK